MSLLKYLWAFKDDPAYWVGYMAGKADDGELSVELEEEMKDRMADKIESDLIQRLEQERNLLLSMVQDIHRASAIGKDQEIPEELEEESDDGFGYIG